MNQKKHHKPTVKSGITITKRFSNKEDAVYYAERIINGIKIKMHEYIPGPKAFVSKHNEISVYCTKELMNLIEESRGERPKAALVTDSKLKTGLSNIANGLMLFLSEDDAKKELERQYTQFLLNNPDYRKHNYINRLGTNRFFAFVSKKDNNEIICRWNVYTINLSNYAYDFLTPTDKKTEIVIERREPTILRTIRRDYYETTDDWQYN